MIKKLDWDSNFWNLKIANLSFENNNFREEEYNVSNSDYDIIQSKVEIDEKKIINFLEINNFKFDNLEVSLDKDLKNYNLKKIEYELAQKKDIEDVCIIASNVFKESRFEKFEKISNQTTSNFYSLWAKKSILGTFNDYCIIKRDESNRIMGFITLKLINNDLAQIGLFGVGKSYQNSGVGSSLLKSTIGFLIKNNIKKIIVSTQGTNYKALNFYYKNNFKLNKISSWYYKFNIFNEEY